MEVGLFVDSVDIFDHQSHRDGYTYRWSVLKEIFNEHGIDLVPIKKVVDANSFDVVIENGIRSTSVTNKFLLIIESPLVRPDDWDLKEHEKYQKIFCWDDDLVDNKKYFKLNYAFNIPKTIPKWYEQKKLCCTIAGNKVSSHPDELYSKRVDLIRWFEKYHPDKFDLYGTQWDEYRFGRSLVGKALNRIRPLRTTVFPSYKGKVVSKYEVLQKYKFAICYENIKDQKGYITEKIFDCLFAGCIPIYWGAANVCEYIPKACFIDKREFSTFEELYTYICKMSESTYRQYLDNIERFLNSPKIDPFRATIFANTIVDEVVRTLKG